MPKGEEGMAAINRREVAESARAARIPCKGFVRRRVSKSAYLRAVQTEGRYIMTPEGDAWWREQERRNPCILAGGNRPEGTDSANGRVNRYGRVKERRTKEGWEHWDAKRNGWVPGELTPRRGIA